jgi:hypothetical protein
MVVLLLLLLLLLLLAAAVKRKGTALAPAPEPLVTRVATAVTHNAQAALPKLLP